MSFAPLPNHGFYQAVIDGLSTNEFKLYEIYGYTALYRATGLYKPVKAQAGYLAVGPSEMAGSVMVIVLKQRFARLKLAYTQTAEPDAECRPQLTT